MLREVGLFGLAFGVSVAAFSCGAGDSGGGNAGSGAGGAGGSSASGGGGSGGAAGTSGGGSGGGSGGSGTGGTSAGGTGAGGGTGATGGTATGGGAGDSGLPDVTFSYDAGQDVEQEACVAVTAEPKPIKRPMDIIFAIDNSCSMSTETAAVENNINGSFATIIGASGIDYRVIMLTRHGSASLDLCIKSPLSGTTCNPVPAQPVDNPPIFYHYNRVVASHDSLCLLLSRYNLADANGKSTGYKDWLRTQALKVFVEITDDGVLCSYGGTTYNDSDTVAAGQTTAAAWDAALLALDPTQFGTAAKRNYVFYSILGMKANTPATAPWGPTDPVTTTMCSTGAGPGTAYQWLSNMTGAYKFPVCEGSGFDAVFQEIAKGVIEGAQVPCEYDMPQTDGGIVDPSKVKLEYTPGGTGTPVIYDQVADQNACGGNDGFYYDNPSSPTKVILCPKTCATVQADPTAKVSLQLGCLGS